MVFISFKIVKGGNPNSIPEMINFKNQIKEIFGIPDKVFQVFIEKIYMTIQIVIIIFCLCNQFLIDSPYNYKLKQHFNICDKWS